ncbi:hypothetical protein [Sphaerisporangium aureirubrum]|uniref:DUF302 domain-containing protein n=1 Tax=Sphaerisporangium aureirubrum TaxID=1544736 RepID=A0ABW1NBA3_9ACTN
MANGQTATGLRAEWHEDDAVSESAAEDFSEALAGVQRLLSRLGVRSFRIQTIRLRLAGESSSRRIHMRLAPELVIPAGDGRPIAVVTVGARSGSWLVSVRGPLPDVLTTDRRKPEEIADVVLGALALTREVS